MRPRWDEGQFQLTWAVLHMYAALLAAMAVAMHAGSARYHLRRFRSGAL